MQLNELQQKPEMAADIILFSSDDDDWFSPVIVRELESVRAEIGGVHLAFGAIRQRSSA